MRYPDVGRIGGYANELKAALRRRKSSRAPRARVRIGNSEPRLLPADDRHSARLLTLADRLAQRSDGVGEAHDA